VSVLANLGWRSGDGDGALPLVLMRAFLAEGVAPPADSRDATLFFFAMYARAMPLLKQAFRRFGVTRRALHTISSKNIGFPLPAHACVLTPIPLTIPNVYRLLFFTTYMAYLPASSIQWVQTGFTCRAYAVPPRMHFCTACCYAVLPATLLRAAVAVAASTVRPACRSACGTFSGCNTTPLPSSSLVPDTAALSPAVRVLCGFAAYAPRLSYCQRCYHRRRCARLPLATFLHSAATDAICTPFARPSPFLCRLFTAPRPHG